MSVTDVIIVGYGPTAAIAANLLGAKGWRVDVFERGEAIHPLPRAVHYDDEVMRLFQQLGLAEQIEPLTQPVQGMDLVNGDGTVLGRYVAPPAPGPQGWASGFMFHQPELEAQLRKGVERYPNVRVHNGHEVEHIEITQQGARVRARAAGGEVVEVGAAFVLGCCGARSITRGVIGKEPLDHQAHKAWIVVDVHLLSDVRLSDATVQYCDAARPATSIPTPGATRRFELMLMPGETAEDMVQPQRIAALLSPWLQPQQYRVERAAVYNFRAAVAPTWRKGPLMIAGDAAHLMPPFLGQNLCSGARDAANLAWKLDLILRGVADDSLLDTYQQEREPHVRALIESDLWLANFIQTTDHEAARLRDAQIAASAGALSFSAPTPALGGDLCGNGPADRLLSIQPVLEGGVRHDELLGDGFALVGDIAPSAWADGVLQRLGARRLPQCGPGIGQWLRDAGAVAALVRPDRYVLAMVQDAAGLDAALAPLARHLRPEPA